MSHCLTVLKTVLMVLQNNMCGYRSAVEHFYSVTCFTERRILVR